MFDFKDPVHSIDLTFALVPRDKLVSGRYQRPRSSALVTSLLGSLAHGFICPILVVPWDGKYEVVDGQHRLEAIDGVIAERNSEIPCIILPEPFRNVPLIYNQEKSDNIKDKAEKLHSLYVDLTREHGDALKESDISSAYLHQPHIITIAFAYKESGLSSPSLVETAVKKFDKDPIDTTLNDAIEIRRNMGNLAATLEATINEIAKEWHVTDFNLKKSILSQTTQSLWGRARNIDLPYQEGMEAIIEGIEERDWSWLSRR